MNYKNYKEKQLQAVLNSPFQIGEKVWVKKKYLDSNTRSPNFHETYVINNILGDIAQITTSTKKNGNVYELPIDNLEKVTLYIGLFTCRLKYNFLCISIIF